MLRFCYYYGMKMICSTIVLFLMFSATVTASELSVQENQALPLTIDDPAAAETYYGVLTEGPYTYQFRVSGEPITFSAQLSSVGREVAEANLSLILVKNEKRGVSEIARRRAESAQWTVAYNAALGLSFIEGEVLEATLEEGVYKLEVSTPENLSPFRLAVNGGSKPSYTELFMVRDVFERSIFSTIRTARIALPLLLILGGWLYIRKRKHA